MSVTRYSKYRNSGVAWFGEVPEHWKLVTVRLLFELGRGRVISHEEISNNPGEYPVYSSQTENNGEMGRLATYDFCGDYLTWTTDGANAGTVFRRSGKFNCTNVCGTLKPRNQEVFLDYCVHALSISTSSFVRQDINPKLMNNVMAGIGVLLPPLEEQRAISMYLSRELTETDALVKEQEKLIALLKEKRQAVISHAVTKGIDPSVPMKDSGIEWLGEVPEHWEVKPLKYVLANSGIVRGPFGGDLKKDSFVDDGLKVYEQKNAIYQDYSLGDSYISKSKYESMLRFTVYPGDFILSCSGTIGKAYLIPDDAPIGIINQALMIIRFNDQIQSEYATCIFSSDFFQRQILDNSQGGAMKNLVGIDKFSSINIPTPPRAEQIAIAEFIEHELKEIDYLVLEVEKAISLLKERRSTLITAAVTGKIDVRGLDTEEVTA